jgi:hypothetical protein
MSTYQVNRAVKSKDITIPAPIMGLNKEDPVSAMNPLYAVRMDNYIPMDNYVELRPGYSMYYQFESGKIKTLSSYHYPSHNKFFAVVNGKIWDVTSATNVTDMNVTLTNDYCQTVQYKNYLYFMNGNDTPKAFYVDNNGDEHIGDWGFTSTNLNASKIIAGTVSKEFLWFIEENTLTVWYSSVAGSISGTLSSFDLSQIAKYGGKLLAIANWTIDGGTGIDDYTAFITSEGEVLVYAGTNPSEATAWELKGSYKIAKPIGYRCTMQYQGDIVIITQDGYFPMGKALATANAGDSLVAFSSKIRGLVIERTSQNKNRQGWQGIIYTKKGYAIFNVPVAEQFEQHVININSGAWCRFVGIRAFCWCLFDDNLYFAADDGVYRFDNAHSDNGVAIDGVVEQAFNDLGTPNVKKIQLLNPRTKSTAPFELSCYVDMDYRKRNLTYINNIGLTAGSLWDVSPWDTSYWAVDSADDVNSQWIMCSGAGFKASVVFKTKTRGILVDWFDTGIRYEQGSGIM